MVYEDYIAASVQSGNARETLALVIRALKENSNPFDIIGKGLLKGMTETEKKARGDQISRFDVIMAERAVKAGLDVIAASLKSGQSANTGTVITGTLEGDIRETEKNITACLMRSLGLDVVDLGTSVPAVRFIEAALEKKARLIVCNTALTIFLPRMKTLAQAAAQAGIREKTKILLSGRPVTEWFCKSIGADLYAANPVQAAELAAKHCKAAI